jgi:hypothetical protein
MKDGAGYLPARAILTQDNKMIGVMHRDDVAAVVIKEIWIGQQEAEDIDSALNILLSAQRRPASSIWMNTVRLLSLILITKELERTDSPLFILSVPAMRTQGPRTSLVK